jgi:hypothetical protein
MLSRYAVFVLASVFWPLAASAQTATNAFQPMTASDRVTYIVDGSIGPTSLGVGVIAAGWDTALNNPSEWNRTWEGFGRRYAEREADVSISNSIEAGLGAIWGEQARYTRSSERGFKKRLGHALKTVFLAEYRDGHLAPAWGRYASNIFNNVIENSWLPPSQTTWQQTTLRGAEGFVGRAIGNVWEEFQPEIVRLLRRK